MLRQLQQICLKGGGQVIPAPVLVGFVHGDQPLLFGGAGPAVNKLDPAIAETMKKLTKDKQEKALSDSNYAKTV